MKNNPCKISHDPFSKRKEDITKQHPSFYLPLSRYVYINFKKH